MKTARIACFVCVLLLVTSGAAWCDVLIGAPYMAPSRVDDAGVLHEDWGTVDVQLVAPAPDPSSRQLARELAPGPTAIAKATGGPVAFTKRMYRAPIWPGGVDVLAATVENTSDAAATAHLRLAVPESVGVGTCTAVLGGRLVLGLPTEPQPVRKERTWGCTGGVVRMPDWAKPVGACDPALANISAGMGGVPIEYRFAVAPGSARCVVLGLCESHWGEADRRPLRIYVEGAPAVDADPVAIWGQHVPGCLRFDASDANGDGRLQVVVAPHPEAQDKNTILNAAWVFSTDVYIDTGAVLRGEMNNAAEYYVDVGGEADQWLYEPGALDYALPLQPGEARTLLFLVGSPGGGGVPNPETTAWSAQSLEKAAADVWKGWFRGEAPSIEALPPGLTQESET